MLAFLTANQAANDPMSMISMFLPIVLVFVVFYFFLIRPEKKRKKEITEMRDNLRVGDEIVTIGGIIGKITNIKEDQLTLETGADRNKIRIMRWAVSAPITKDSDAAESASAEIEENNK